MKTILNQGNRHLSKFFLGYIFLEILTYILWLHYFSLNSALLVGASSFLVGSSILKRNRRSAPPSSPFNLMASFQLNGMRTFSGVLLVLPGFITDFLGFILLAYVAIKHLLGKKPSQPPKSRPSSSPSPEEDGITVDGEYTVLKKED